tara:strand:+ start:1320 stop:1601 length:282 start_codon:yes stop_codon:yes gene_type:complete
MQTLIVFMSFLDFLFAPLVVALIVSIIIEQIIRRLSNPEWHDDRRWINTSMRVRKFLWTQNIIVNVLWFIGYFIVMFMVGRESPQMPDMIWQG